MNMRESLTSKLRDFREEKNRILRGFQMREKSEAEHPQKLRENLKNPSKFHFQFHSISFLLIFITFTVGRVINSRENIFLL